MTYPTLDHISDLTPSQMASASQLYFSVNGGAHNVDFGAATYGDAVIDTEGWIRYPVSKGLYKFQAVAGATYQISSASYHDPNQLTVYDQDGNAVAQADEQTGTLGYTDADGVYYKVDELVKFVAPYSGVLYVSAGWRLSATYPLYHLSVAETRGQTIGGTDAAEVLVGTRYSDKIDAKGGNDTITSSGGNDHIDGGAGIDTVWLPAAAGSYTITRNYPGNEESSADFIAETRGTSTNQYHGQAMISLTGVERVWMDGQKIALDVDGNGGQAYRLYQAAFDRAPDPGGLGYQMKALDDGWSLSAVAANFIASPEFQSKYGQLDDVQYVTQLYANVLHRDPDAGGLAYHLDRLSHGVQREVILVGFSESPENQANVIGAIANGMTYIV